jgi:hypothetical protein
MRLCKSTLQLLDQCNIFRLGGLKRLNDIQIGVQVDLLGAIGPLVLHMEQSVSKVYDEEDWDSNIGSEERAGSESTREEYVKSIDKGQNGESDDSSIGTEWLEAGMVWDISLALDLARLAEPEVYYGTADPGDESGGIGEVDKPSENSGTSIGAVQVCQSTEKGGDEDCHIWHTLFGAALEDGRSVASDCQGV